MWANGDLALLFNTGPLVQPVTRAQYRANRSTRPANLFSHDDQQEQNQTALPNNQATVGWGGRLGDRVMVMNAGSSVPMNISVGGNDIFLKGQATPAYSVPTGGNFGLTITGGTAAQQTARRNAMQALFGLDRQNLQVQSAADVISSAVNASTALNAVVNNNASAAAPAFQGLNTGLARQLLAVAKMIEGRAQLGLRRQIFFAQAGGFDNHQNQIQDQAARLGEVGPALRAFYNAIVALGVQDQVTLFTLSDFGRTLRVNDGGSDHAWGNHHIILGGAVRGGQTYGTFRTSRLAGRTTPTPTAGGSRRRRWTSTRRHSRNGSACPTPTFRRWFRTSRASRRATWGSWGRGAGAGPQGLSRGARRSVHEDDHARPAPRRLHFARGHGRRHRLGSEAVIRRSSGSRWSACSSRSPSSRSGLPRGSLGERRRRRHARPARAARGDLGRPVPARRVRCAAAVAGGGHPRRQRGTGRDAVRVA